VKGEWRAYTGGRPDFDGLTRLPNRFDKGRSADRIEVEAIIDGYKADFLVDTGAPGLHLTGRVARDSKLWESDKPYAPARAFGIGDGDGVPARLYRAKELKVGPLVFNDMMVMVDAPGTISGGREGIIGLSVLSQLHLSTDVSAGALYAARNGIQAPPQTYPLSGLYLGEEKGRVFVTDVGKGSPAAQAGVRTGDVLPGGNLQAMIRATVGGPGKEIALKVVRGGIAQEVRYTLKPWF
jgi:serine protease Do